MKEHKNPKVLSEGLLWMVSTVEDFGVSHLKLKYLIDFCKDTRLLSGAAATPNATIKVLGALHKFIGPDIKGFLTDVKPALLSALDAEYEKNPLEKTVEASESTSLSAGQLDSLPHEDISGKITPALLKSLESPDWKVRGHAQFPGSYTLSLNSGLSMNDGKSWRKKLLKLEIMNARTFIRAGILIIDILEPFRDKDLSEYTPSSSGSSKNLSSSHQLYNTSSSGYLVEDKLHLKSFTDHAAVSSVQTSVIVGRQQNVGYLDVAAPDGLMRLGPGNISVPSLLAKAIMKRGVLFMYSETLFDSGNNNLLLTIAKSNFPPYGHNFVRHFAGRFTNGRTLPEFIAEFLELPYPSACNSESEGAKILKILETAADLKS
ncbi:hypothetical protein REPUB_Repub04eG0266000 [Reevesia pubescens]